MNEAESVSLKDAAMLHYPNRENPYSVYCDVSDTGIAAVLCQPDDPIKGDVPVCFVSRKVKSSEINYATVEKELLAVVYALFKFRRYVLDRKKFTIYTDNMALKLLFQKKEPNTRLQRWCLALQESDFEIKHIPGTNNPSDYFSRYPMLDASDHQDGQDVLEQLFSNLYMAGHIESLDYEVDLKQLHRCLTEFLGPEITKQEMCKLEIKSTTYMLGEYGHLYRLVGSRSDQRYVKIPFKQERPALLAEVHDGHGCNEIATQSPISLEGECRRNGTHYNSCNMNLFYKALKLYKQSIKILK